MWPVVGFSRRAWMHGAARSPRSRVKGTNRFVAKVRSLLNFQPMRELIVLPFCPCRTIFLSLDRADWTDRTTDTSSRQGTFQPRHQVASCCDMCADRQHLDSFTSRTATYQNGTGKPRDVSRDTPARSSTSTYYSVHDHFSTCEARANQDKFPRTPEAFNHVERHHR